MMEAESSMGMRSGGACIYENKLGYNGSLNREKARAMPSWKLATIISNRSPAIHPCMDPHNPDFPGRPIRPDLAATAVVTPPGFGPKSLNWVVMGWNENYPVLMGMNGVLESSLIFRAGGGVGGDGEGGGGRMGQ